MPRTVQRNAQKDRRRTVCSKTAAIPEVRGVPPPVILRSGSDEGSVFPAAGDWDGKRSFAALRMTRRENARDDEDGGIPGMTRTRRCPGRCREVPRKTGGEQCTVRQRQSPKSEECLPPVILRSGSDEGSVSPAAGGWDGKRSFAALRMTRRENTRDDEDGGCPG